MSTPTTSRRLRFAAPAPAVPTVRATPTVTPVLDGRSTGARHAAPRYAARPAAPVPARRPAEVEPAFVGDPTALPGRRRAPARPPLTHGLRAHGRSSWRGDVAVSLAGLGLGLAVGIGVAAVADGLPAPGGPALAAGTVAALAGSYLCLVLLVLTTRVPWIEREVGHDRLLSLHRRVAPYSLVLVAAHVVLTTLGYAQATRTSFLGQLWTTVTTSAWMVPAATAFVLMVALGVMSARFSRRRMRYETWWVAHLYFYLAVALSFGHQLVLGPMFVSHPVQRWFWTGLYVGVGATILVSRFGRPIAMSLRHRLRVETVVEESPGVVSIYLSGHHLDQLRARGGQFFCWRFLTADWWWQAHPYSLSAAPNPSWLRITVKDLGDHSGRLSRLRPGTRVWAEGPYGVFTAAARHGERVAAFAAGVGITPVRAVLDDLPPSAEVTLVYRVPDAADALLRAEIDELADRNGWTVHYLENQPERPRLTPELLTRLVPELTDTDIYLCGPPAFMSDLLAAARAVGVAPHRIHHETFVF